VELLLARNADIPEYLADGVCQLALVGENMLAEAQNGGRTSGAAPPRVLARLGYGRCRLALAVPQESRWESPADLEGVRVATSYPATTRRFFEERKIPVTIVEIMGGVEAAPSLGVAEVICDLVSTGTTLAANGLREVGTLLASEVVLAQTGRGLTPEQLALVDRLTVRVGGVLRAQGSKYIMMNAPKKALDEIRAILPGLEAPTVMELHDSHPDASHQVSVHAVAPEEVFWETMEELKAAGARGILVVPIEKILE
jgi:ATP phosphoribosyltransferase